ncbi:MAG: excinuclease ABC subunit UvrC [Anaerolineaceae bacterium]|nr:excinuclease ABC subunit UvrC [Anaerolineaceae bacterium]
MTIPDFLQPTIETLPEKPGCYLMKDKQGKVIYVGKAKVLKHRVRSYFHKSAQGDQKTRKLVENIAKIDWIVVSSELEALILEMNLIKKYRPRYNIRLKDDKRYPYIKVHLQMPYPKITITRQMQKDGGHYYGPYTSAWAVHRTLGILRRIFPYLTCNRTITGNDKRACLYYDIKLCSGPCIGAISKKDYRKSITNLGKFLNGETEEIVENIKELMNNAAEALDYEKAAVLRDKLQAIDSIMQQQKIISVNTMNSDVIAMAREENEACVQIFFIRNGKLLGREYFILEGTENEADAVIIEEFIKQFYSKAANIPQEVILPNQIEESKIIETWLRSKRNAEKVTLELPRNTAEKNLLHLAADNAVETLRALKTQWANDSNRQQTSLTDLQEALHLEEAPNRIECYDISHTQGIAMVGSLVVFEQGTPSKKLYRRFNIKTVTGPDDFAAMEEVLVRRFRRWEGTKEQASQGKVVDTAFSILPDLLIVDGGKGQLSRAVRVLEQFGISDKIQLAGLAKQQEEIFLPGLSHSILLPRNSHFLYLFQRVRDEAHRFAITAHRKRRDKMGLASRLDAVPGIGPVRRKALLQKFGGLDGIKTSSLEELMSVAGITEEIAHNLKSLLE